MASKAKREVSFKATGKERLLARKIARRARSLYLDHKVDRDQTDIEMDLLACNANGNPLDFKRLIEADDFNLLHDVSGIARHLDRETGELTNCFRPRFTQRSAA